MRTGTIRETRRLWEALDRPNVFIKVPATAEGLPAIRQPIGAGINVNVTLIFGVPRYRQKDSFDKLMGALAQKGVGAGWAGLRQAGLRPIALNRPMV